VKFENCEIDEDAWKDMFEEFLEASPGYVSANERTLAQSGLRLLENYHLMRQQRDYYCKRAYLVIKLPWRRKKH
jgi:hypothetical protein